MGAGQNPAGGVAGAFPIPGYSSKGSIPKSEFVPLFDLKTRTFQHDENGYLKLVHWVDQAVSFALGISQGDHKSQPTLGNRLRAIKRAGGVTLQADVEDAVRNALSKLVERKDIGVTKMEIATPIRGMIYVAVYYINLRLSAVDVTKATFLF